MESGRCARASAQPHHNSPLVEVRMGSVQKLVDPGSRWDLGKLASVRRTSRLGNSWRVWIPSQARWCIRRPRQEDGTFKPCLHQGIADSHLPLACQHRHNGVQAAFRRRGTQTRSPASWVSDVAAAVPPHPSSSFPILPAGLEELRNHNFQNSYSLSHFCFSFFKILKLEEQSVPSS